MPLLGLWLSEPCGSGGQKTPEIKPATGGEKAGVPAQKSWLHTGHAQHCLSFCLLPCTKTVFLVNYFLCFFAQIKFGP